MIYGLSTAATLFEPNPRQIAAAGRFFWGSVDGLYTSGGWSHQIKRHASINEYPMSLEIFSLWRALYGRNDEENDCAVSPQPKSTVVRINLEHNSLARHAGIERLVGGLRRLVTDLGSVVKVTQPTP